MTEFKGKNGEGMRRSRAAAGVLAAGDSSPAGGKYGGGAGKADPGPSRVCSHVETPYPKSSFFHGGVSLLVGLEDAWFWRNEAGQGHESRCLIQSPEDGALGGLGRRLKASEATKLLFSRSGPCVQSSGSQIWQHSRMGGGGAYCSNADS